MAVAVATILAASGLGYTFMTSETNHRSDENLRAEIETVNSDLTSLQNKLITLNTSLTKLSKSLSDLDSDLKLEIVNLQANVSSLSTQISGLRNDVSTIQNDISAIQISVSSLESQVSSLETRVSALEEDQSIAIRINFVSFIPDNTPPGGEDYLFDAEATGPNIYAQARTGHSRFIKPRYLDLVVRNGKQFIGAPVTIKLYAYWHLDDVVIDIDPDPAHGRTIGTNPSGGYLTLSYAIGTVLSGSVNGNDDGYALDLYDAYFAYKIETLP